MKVELIRHNGRDKRLILIFAGWSTTPALYADVRIPGWDVAVVHDYSDLSLDTDFLENYHTVYLFAWSLGVAAAQSVLPADRITAAYALNGSLNPVSDTGGIPADIYFGTLENLSQRNLTKFRMRMAGDTATFKAIFGGETPDENEVENLKQQLQILAHLPEHETAASLPWRKAYIGEQDRIFPSANLVNAWSSEKDVEIVVLPKPHYIPMQEIVSVVIPDTTVVGKKFEYAASTYNDHAIVQREIAAILFSLFRKFTDERRISYGSPLRILEIGPGTGFLTRLYTTLWPDAEIDMVDIAQIPDIPAQARFHRDDAELWLRRCSGEYDIILSSSTIQWFSNPAEFFSQVHRVLKPGGVMAISSFAPGNLAELNTLRPSPLHYHSKGGYASMIAPLFPYFVIEEDSISIDFESPREMLMHLKRTGVGGSAPSPQLKLGAMRAINRITYRPLYMVAQKNNI